MPDIIHLLPDNIANQIAAGEVIQRPASAVKELLENAVDAGATEIKLIIEDAGKALVQVIDNGKGMSESDARMCFERHATSKIKKIDDLFHIRTMGFRGEALASIAAVAQVELKTRREEDEVGCFVEIENSAVVREEPVAAPVGTCIAMKNLFFNVPARRNFLKSNGVEMKHIVDEFTRVALSFPSVFFSLTNNGQDMFYLEKGNLKQRIIQLMGNQYSSRLVAVNDNTDYLNIYGFIGKPETAKKTRGDQYLFVNNRFIRSAYLNHALQNAYKELIPADSFPSYVLFIDLDPAQVDVNVHPTKQEIKFEDEKIVYAFVQAAVKYALAQFSITPTLEFDIDAAIQQSAAVSQPFTEQKKAIVASSSLFQSFTKKNQAHFIEPTQKSDLKNWRDFFDKPADKLELGEPEITLEKTAPKEEKDVFSHEQELIQLNNAYIIYPSKGGYLLISQQAAHERVLYERYTNALQGSAVATQSSLFPVTLDLSPQDTVMLSELLPDLQQLGYLIEPFGNNSFVIQGTPADIEEGNEKAVIENILEQYKHFTSEVRFSKKEKLIRTMAWQRSIKPGRHLTQQEMKTLVQDMFSCKTPNVTVSGNPTYIEFRKDYIEKLFSK
ncbi:MAG TPA: DNA mismatch repair endonuclease MutL [Chitinophagaceae bacterium]|nr:DNA mismatch repair endonuclease MutL [Chitinophagaceae bacterium]